MLEKKDVQIILQEAVRERLEDIARTCGIDINRLVNVALYQFAVIPQVISILTPWHAYWISFIEALGSRVIKFKDDMSFVLCDGSYKYTEDILETYKRFGIDPELTLLFFKKNNLLCDCTVLEFSGSFSLGIVDES